MSEKTITLEHRLHRQMKVERAVEEDDGDMRLELSFSSEFPVRRFLDGDIGMEVLDHSPESVILDRMNDGGPVITDHRNSVDNLHAVVESVSLEGRVGRAIVRFHDDPASRIVYSKAKSGVLRNVSVGYDIHRFTKEVDEKTGDVTFRVTSWEPMEISMVAIPADPTVGPGRKVSPYEVRMDEQPEADEPPELQPEEVAADADREVSEVEPGEQPDPNPERTIEMNEDELKQARIDGAKSERERVAGIREIVGVYPQLRDLGDKAINGDQSVEQFRAIALSNLGNLKPMPPAPEIGLDEKQARGFSLLRLFRALSFGQQDRSYLDAAGFELEVCGEAARVQQEVGVKKVHGTIVPIEVLRLSMMDRSDGNMTRAIVSKFPELARAMSAQRVLTAGTATDGAELVAEELRAGSFIDVLRNASVVTRAGATLLTDLNGNIAIPRKTSGSVAGWLATEAVSDAAQSEPQFDQVTMTPRNIAVYGEYSRQLLLQSSLAIEELLRADLAAGLATEMDRAALYGSGGAGQPTGVSGQTGINTPTNFAAANPTWSEVVAMETAIAVDNALREGGMSYMLKPDMRGALKTTTKVSADAGAGFIWDVNSPGSPLNGYPAWVTNQIVSGDLFMGYWPDLFMGMWGGLDVIVDPYTQARKGVVGVTNHQSTDIAVRHPVSFAFNNDGL